MCRHIITGEYYHHNSIAVVRVSTELSQYTCNSCGEKWEVESSVITEKLLSCPNDGKKFEGAE